MYGDPILNRQIKICQCFAMAIWDPTAKFNSHQYFRLYGISRVLSQGIIMHFWCFILIRAAGTIFTAVECIVCLEVSRDEWMCSVRNNLRMMVCLPLNK